MTDQTFPYLNNTKSDIRLIGIPNIVGPFSHFNSAPRVGMFNHHLPQTMIIDEPEFNKMFTGVEHNFIDYVFNPSKREFDCEIVAIIPKYRGLVKWDDCPQFYVITLTKEGRDASGREISHLDYFTIDRYFMGANGFGWIPEIENVHRIKKGEILNKEAVITHSPAVKDDMYCLGTNLNVIYGSFPETIEDAFIISESAARRLQTQQVSQIVINCRMDRRPLNLNGDHLEDKFLPDIGSYVREDGLLCASRPVHWTTVLADTDPAALREFLPLQDDPIYIPTGSKIVDLTFNINRNRPLGCYDQAKEYERLNTKCWEDIYSTYLQYKGKYNLTPKMSTLVTTSIYRMVAQGAHVPLLQNDDEFRKATRNFDIEGVNNHNIDFIQAVVTYTVPRPVSNGSKLTDFSGSKGVVGRIYPDDWMPVDKFGIRADMWIDMNSPVSRNNPGQLYETGINRINEFVRRKVADVYEIKGTDAAHDTLLDWYNDINPNYAKLIKEGDVSGYDRKITVEEAIKYSPRVWIPPFLDTLTPKDDEFWNALINVKSWAQKWGVEGSPVTYKSLQADGTGKEFTTESLFNIGSKYIIHLHKIPEIFAPGPASVNHIGVPTKSNFEAKHFPVTVNPYRYGEDELRMIAIDAPIREVTRMQNLLSNSPTGVNKTIQSYLTADHPTRIKRIPISNGDLFRSSAILKLFHNTTAALGVQTKSTKNDGYTKMLQDILETSNDLDESIWNADFITDKEGKYVVVDEDDEEVGKKASTKRAKVQKMIDLMEPDEVENDDGFNLKLEDAEEDVEE